MSFNKFTTFKLDFDDIEIIDNELLKTASFKLPDGVQYDPDYLYLKVKAVSAGEYWGCNKNYDYFPEKELIDNYKTFLSAHTFKNHENKKIECAIGDVLTAEWCNKMKCVYLVIRIDRRIAPTIVRGFEKKFMTDVSMGCRVDHVICSYCGKKAKTKFDYCEHLKTMKGKVMDDGKKVYEINMKPKFHDISAVLNGAERTAKAVGLYVHGDKVAYEFGNETLEKTASVKNSNLLSLFNENSESQFRDSYANDNIVKIASSYFDNDKVAEELKVAEFKKQLEGKIINSAQQKFESNNVSKFEKIADLLKLLYTDYWSKDKCTKIADKIKDIAKQNRVSPDEAFNQFLKVSDFAGIELSPLEMHDIFNEVIDNDTCDIRDVKCLNNFETGFGGIENVMDTGDSLESLIPKCHMLSDMSDNIDNSIKETPKHTKILIKTIKSSPIHNNDSNDSLIHDIMSKIITDLMPTRSSYKQFLYPRLAQIAGGRIQPHVHAFHHQAPLKIVMIKKTNGLDKIAMPVSLSNTLYASYQNERVARFENGSLEDGFNKIASYFMDVFSLEKTASGGISPLKASIASIPVIYSYSALQRSRMNNGEYISSLNRYIADNPSNAAFIQAYIANKGAGIINRNIPKFKNVINHLGKTANEHYDDNNSDMFKNAVIDESMSNKGYSDKDIATIKYACVLNGIGQEGVSEEMLANRNLSSSDVEEYLKTAECCFTIEIEKTASNFFRTVGDSVLGDIILNNTKKTSGLAALPGYVTDGLIIAGIGKGLSNAAKKKKGAI